MSQGPFLATVKWHKSNQVDHIWRNTIICADTEDHPLVIHLARPKWQGKNWLTKSKRVDWIGLLTIAKWKTIVSCWSFLILQVTSSYQGNEHKSTDLKSGSAKNIMLLVHKAYFYLFKSKMWLLVLDSVTVAVVADHRRATSSFGYAIQMS